MIAIWPLIGHHPLPVQTFTIMGNKMPHKFALAKFGRPYRLIIASFRPLKTGLQLFSDHQPLTRKHLQLHNAFPRIPTI